MLATPQRYPRAGSAKIVQFLDGLPVGVRGGRRLGVIVNLPSLRARSAAAHIKLPNPAPAGTGPKSLIKSRKKSAEGGRSRTFHREKPKHFQAFPSRKKAKKGV
jgi:hypothetical protein